MAARPSYLPHALVVVVVMVLLVVSGRWDCTGRRGHGGAAGRVSGCCGCAGRRSGRCGCSGCGDAQSLRSDLSVEMLPTIIIISIFRMLCRFIALVSIPHALILPLVLRYESRVQRAGQRITGKGTRGMHELALNINTSRLHPPNGLEVCSSRGTSKALSM